MKILLAALTSSFMLAACTPRIEVAAPKEPITINMNVKIEHEITGRARPAGGEWAVPYGSFLRLRIYSKKSRTGWFGISFVHVRPLW